MPINIGSRSKRSIRIMKKPANELAMPSLAEKEMLQSEWFEVPNLVIVPPEEFLYAATNDAKGHSTERMPSSGMWDQTWVQMQRWYAYIRPVELPPQPFGEWLVADLKAVRGQFVGEVMPVRLPIWFMSKGMFLFRENPRRVSGVVRDIRRPKAESRTNLEFGPGADAASSSGGLRGRQRQICGAEEPHDRG